MKGNVNSLVTFNVEKDPEISFYETIPWKTNEYHDVEFFADKITRVYLVSNQHNNLENILQRLESNENLRKNSQSTNMIAIDLEWEISKLCLIQFCSNKTCVIVRLFTKEDLEIHPELKIGEENEDELLQKNNKILENFLNGHKFYGKGMRNDQKMLLSYFGQSFSNNFEDIEKTRLIPNKLSLNFNIMTKMFAGESTAPFKVIEMTKSDWSVPELSFRQVLYAAFDTVALYYCYPNFPPIKIQDESKAKSKEKEKGKSQEQNQKNKKIRNVKYYKSAKSENKNPNQNTKKVKKMNLSVVFKEKERRETFSYLIKNYQGTKNKLMLKSFLPDLDFISYFEGPDSTSYLFISSFSPIKNFSKFLSFKFESSIQNCINQKTIEITNPDEPLSCAGIEQIFENIFYLPQVPFSLCNDTDVLFVTSIPTTIFTDERKLQDLFYCFGYDQIVSRIDDKYQNSCIVEPRNFQISRRIRTFLPFVSICDSLLKVYEYPSFLRTVRLSNIPSNFTENDLNKLFVHNGYKIAESCEFLLKRIQSDSQTAYVMFDTLQDKEIFSSKFNHFKLRNLKEIGNFDLNIDNDNYDDELLVIPFSSDVHYRYLRSFEINVYLKDQSRLTFDDIFNKFSKFGKILQMNYDKRFNNYHIQFYRKCDALKAYEHFTKLCNCDDECFANQVIIEMYPEGSTIIVRDLPLEIKEEELISTFSKFGKIANLVFRDLTPMNMLSIADIHFRTSEEAKEVKQMMNKSKIGGTFIHVSIRSREDVLSSKMSQRNQWVVFDDSYQTIEDIFARTKSYGKIIDYNHINNHFLAMFDTQENAKLVIDELKLSYPTYVQFVEETNNSNYLKIVQKQSISGNPVEQKESAIIVDPVSRSLTEDFIEKIFIEGNATSANEASTLVQASSLMLPSLKDIIKPKNSSEKNECQYKHELFITDSVKFQGQKRLIIYTPSNNVTKKLFTLIKNSKFEGEYFKPKKIDVKDLENPPQRKIKKILFEGVEVSNSVEVIDPLPDGFGVKEIRENIKDLPNIEMVVCKSSKIKGKSRAVLMPKMPSQKRKIHKALSRIIIDDENLHLFEYKCDSIPPPL
ncbi:hypothetical protein M9Y10_011207 [Tritrichomonas musculus]|uniref:RRM domain-containing protein n=1 Tax=Tritrichomonas musculus TaxID=1915356 RepID=A0ABR2IJ09_9EUKA